MSEDEIVECPECGFQQLDPGKGVACEECGHYPLVSLKEIEKQDKEWRKGNG